ncbi:uncharacterized protein [Phyllobates terribilis]|uniref:uncharacterized protein n=1 Tax=Phyllobates terribilis TaxID=111132 RepID=UPI003CCB58B3
MNVEGTSGRTPSMTPHTCGRHLGGIKGAKVQRGSNNQQKAHPNKQVKEAVSGEVTSAQVFVISHQSPPNVYDMMTPEKRLRLVLLQRLRTPTLVILLLFMETLLGVRFHCPEKRSIVVVYCLMYLLLPAFFLAFSNLLLRPRQSSDAFPSLPPPPSSHIIFLILQLGKAPLIWVFIVMLNRTFLSCLFQYVDYDARLYVFPSLQISGLILLLLCLVLEYYSPHFPFLQDRLQYHNSKRYEELVLREIEVVIQEAAEEKRRSFIQTMISADLDKLDPGNPGMQDVTLRLIQQHQERVQRGFIAGGEGREPVTMVHEAQSESPPQIPI